jgi:protein-L-isoaspartate O-methyltransferase
MIQNENRCLKVSGRLGLKARADLLQNCLAVWPRRGKRLLEINCGEGFFLPVLWECGFDVTATEHEPDLRNRALAHVGFRAEIMASSDEYLPFEDDAFDWVILHAAAKDWPAFENSLTEALRVATGGLAVAFWNSASFSYMLSRLSDRGFWPRPRYNCFSVWRKLKQRGMGRLTSLSALSGPVRTWNRVHGGVLCQAVTHVLPLGAWCIVRMDIAPPGSVTPLPLRLRNARFASPATALECHRVGDASGDDKE